MAELTTEIGKHMVTIFSNVPGVPQIQIVVRGDRLDILMRYRSARNEHAEFFLEGDDGRGGVVDFSMHTGYIAGIIVGNMPSGIAAPIPRGSRGPLQ